MKKSVMLAVAVIALAVSTAGCAQPGHNNGYYNRGYSNANGWNYAAAALGGVIVGGVIGAIVNSNNQPQYAPVPVYALPGPGYVPAPAYSPGWQQRCNNAQTVPVANAYGQIVNYTIICR
jgi:hypothetical protein